MSSEKQSQTSIRMKQVLAGASSGMITKTAIAPLERVKILHQIQGMRNEAIKYRGIWQTTTTVLQEEGFLALYKGNGANVVRVIPNYALKFAFNDTIRDMVRKPGQSVREMNFNQLMMAGTLAGLMQITLTYPLELVRTRLSLSESQMLGERYTGIVDCCRKTVKSEGMGALYKGITPTWWSGAPYVGLQMTSFELFKRLFPVRDDGSTATIWNLCSGALAGIVAQTITFPGDTLRRRMQTNGMGGSERIYSTTWDACVKIVQREGWRAYYKGLNANLIRCIPGAAIQFEAYELAKKWLGC